MPTVTILTTGYEVLRGFTANTNATWLARRATESGARVVGMRTVGDSLAELTRGLEESLAEAACVLVTGGLGPTEDDRTREALAKVAGVPLVDDPRAWEMVRVHFERSKRAPSPTQRRQGLVPRGFEALPNEQGTAPGITGRVGDRRVFLLPGPPREMTAMFEREVLPRWKQDGGFDEAAARVLWTAGVPESEIAAPIETEMRADEPTVGTHPDDGEVAVRILARGGGAAARADALRDGIARRLGPHVVSTVEHERVQHAVVGLLKDRGLVITTAESITGGLVSRMLVEVAGASTVFRGGHVTYSDEWKSRVLGVPEALIARDGAVSESVAIAMADRARELGRADVAVSTTGYAGPSANPGEVPGPVFVAVSSRFAPTYAVRFFAAVPRLAVQRRAAVLALDQVRRLLIRA